LGLRAHYFVVPNGLDTNRFARLPARGVTRRRLNIPEQARLLLFLGRLHVKKRPDIAVESLAAAQALPGETHLVLAGPDEMQLVPKLKAQAQRLGCANRIHITGLLKGDEVLSALADADLFLMPSEPESENFGMSAVEAMAAGLPVLLSEGVPVGQWAESARAGRIASCAADSFSKITCEMLAVSDGLREMGRRGQALAGERFDSMKVAQQMLEHYQSIISTGRPAPSI
jgi:glycosyltransferase involved in cell wall biosynthesis